MSILAQSPLCTTPQSPIFNASSVTLAVKTRANPLYIYNTISLLIHFLSRIIFVIVMLFKKNTIFRGVSL